MYIKNITYKKKKPLKKTVLVLQAAENLFIGDVSGNVTVSLLVLNIGNCYMNCCVVTALICT